MLSDPSHDIEDLAQELFLRYWAHYKEHGVVPGPYTVRDWAWRIMRDWKYTGRKCGNLKHGNMEVSFSRHPATRAFDCTDEEIIDGINFERETGMKSCPYGEE